MKYYAIKNGKTPGIYTSWDQAKAQVHGYKGAVYKLSLIHISEPTRRPG